MLARTESHTQESERGTWKAGKWPETQLWTRSPSCGLVVLAGESALNNAITGPAVPTNRKAEPH